MTNRAIRGTRRAMGFAPECEGECTRPAVTYLSIHPVGGCEMNREAERSMLLCEPCLRAQLSSIQDHLLDVFLGLVPDYCPTCLRSTVSLCDTIVSLLPLWEWAEREGETADEGPHP